MTVVAEHNGTAEHGAARVTPAQIDAAAEQAQASQASLPGVEALKQAQARRKASKGSNKPQATPPQVDNSKPLTVLEEIERELVAGLRADGARDVRLGTLAYGYIDTACSVFRDEPAKLKSTYESSRDTICTRIAPHLNGATLAARIRNAESNLQRWLSAAGLVRQFPACDALNGSQLYVLGTMAKRTSHYRYAITDAWEGFARGLVSQAVEAGMTASAMESAIQAERDTREVAELTAKRDGFAKRMAEEQGKGNAAEVERFQALMRGCDESIDALNGKAEPQADSSQASAGKPISSATLDKVLDAIPTSVEHATRLGSRVWSAQAVQAFLRGLQADAKNSQAVNALRAALLPVPQSQAS